MPDKTAADAAAELHVIGIYSDNWGDSYRGAHPVLMVRCSTAEASDLKDALAAVEPWTNSSFRYLTREAWSAMSAPARTAARAIMARYAEACAALDATGVPWCGGGTHAEMRRTQVARDDGLTLALFELHLKAREIARDSSLTIEEGRGAATSTTPTATFTAPPPSKAAAGLPALPQPGLPITLRPLRGEPGQFADDADATTFASSDAVPPEPAAGSVGLVPLEVLQDSVSATTSSPTAAELLAAAEAAVPAFDALLDAWHAFVGSANEYGRHRTQDEMRRVRYANAVMRLAVAELLSLVNDDRPFPFIDDPAEMLRAVADGIGLSEQAYNDGRLDAAARELAAIHRDAATRAARERMADRVRAAEIAEPAAIAGVIQAMTRETVEALVATLPAPARERLRSAIGPSVDFSSISGLPDPPGIGETNLAIDTLADLRRAADECSSTDGIAQFERTHVVFAGAASIVLATYGAQTTSWDVDELGSLRRLAGGAGHDLPGSTSWSELAGDAKSELLDLRLRLLIQHQHHRDAEDVEPLPFSVKATVAGWSELERAEARTLLSDAATQSPATAAAPPESTLPAMPEPSERDAPALDVSKLPPHVVRAGQQLLRAREHAGDPHLTYAKSYAYYMEHLYTAEEDGEVPDLPTWERYARHYLKATGQGRPANEPRSGRDGRSIVRADGAAT